MSSPLHRSFLLSSAAALLSLLQGCGGDEPGVAAASSSAATVRIEGCVVDEYFIPHEGVSIRAVSDDGQTLSYATSGRMGEFILHLPARVPAALAVDRPGGEWMPLPAQDRDRLVDSCLVERSDF